MAWEPPASAFFPVVSQELQAERDVRSNILRKEFEPNSPSIEEEMDLVKKGQQKNNKLSAEDKAKIFLTERSTSNWSPPKEAFEAAAWEPPAEAFEATTSQKLTASAVKGAEFVNIFNGTALGGLSAIGGLITDPIHSAVTKGRLPTMDEMWTNAARRSGQYSEWNIGGVAKKLGVDSRWVEDKLLNIPEEKLAEAARYVGEYLQEKGAPPSVAAAADVTVQAGVLALLFHGGTKALNKVTIGDFKKPADLPPKPVPGDVLEGKNLPPDSSIAPELRQGDMIDPRLDSMGKSGIGVDASWKLDENGIPVRELGPDAAGDLLRPDNSIVKERPAPEDPRQKPLEFESPAEEPLSSSRPYDLSNPKEKMGNEIDYYPDNPDMNIRAEKALDEEMAWTIHNEEKASVQQREARIIAEAQAKYGKGDVEPAQGTRSVEKITSPVSRRGPGKHQSGHGDMFNDFAKKIADAAVWTREKLVDLIDRADKSGDPQGVIPIVLNELTKRSVDKQLADKDALIARTKYDHEVGSRVHLVDGRVGTILSKDYDRFSQPAYRVKIGEDVRVIPEAEVTRSFAGPKPFNPKGQGGAVIPDAFNAVGHAIRGLFTKKSIEHLDNNHVIAQDHRPWGQLKNALKLDEHPLAATEDIGILNKMFNVMPVMTQLNYFNSRGVQILKNIVSRVQEINNQSIQRFKDAIEHSKDFAELPHAEKKALRDVQVKYDGLLNDELANRGLQFLTEDMLRAEGMNPRQIKAYLAEAKGISKAWDMIAEALSWAGQEVRRIPGYFPHVWAGSYKLRLYNGNQLVAIKAYSTAYQAKAVQLLASKELMKEFDATHIEYEAPSSHIKPTDLAVQIAEAIKVSGGRSGFNTNVTKLLTRFDELSKRGIIKEALDRDANIAGYDAQKGMTLDPVNNGRILRAYNDHIEAAAHFWRNAKISKEVYSEYFSDIKHFDNAPHLKAAISEFIQRSTGHPVNHLKWIDELARAASIKLGLPPSTVRTTVRSLGGWVTFAKLMAGNPKFIATQIMQPIIVSSDIVLMAAQHYKATGKWGDFAGAYAAQLKEMFTYELSSLRNKDNTKALDWMKENNKLDVYTADHVNPMKGVDAYVNNRNPLFVIPRHIEERGRGASFIGAYNYFKKIMPEKDAYHAATNTTDMMMGNYEGMNSSSMFTDFGMVGQSVRPFALIRNAYMGKAIMAVQLAVDGLKTLSPKEAAVGIAPLMLQLGSFLAVAGATGFFGFQEWDVLAKYYNVTFKPQEPMTRPAEWLKDRGAPQWMTYGLLSSSIDMDVGGSVAAPAMSELSGIPAIDAGVGAFKLAQAVGDGFTWKEGDKLPRPNNAEKFYQGMKPLSPPWLVAFMENEWIAPAQSGNLPGAQNFGAVYQRDSTEKMKSYFGTKSLKESQHRTDTNLYKSQVLTGTSWKRSIVTRIVNAQLGISGEDMGELISQAISAQKGFDRDSLTAAIKAENLSRLVDEKTRELSGMVKSNNAADKNYKYEIMRRMGLM